MGLLALLLAAAAAAQPPRIMTSGDLASFESPEPDERIAYGDDPLQFGELRLPDSPGPHPVVILIHGGCWLSEFDITHLRKLAAAITGTGVATWALEYRRVGNPGGGWPGTFQDIARGTDHLRVLAKTHPLDLDRVIAAGHSAGGHLALWVAARPKLKDRELFQGENPVLPIAVLGLAPAPDLAYLHEQNVCDGVVDKLLGGSPEDQPERYRSASLLNLVPLQVPQILILGDHDKNWTPVGRRYFEAAKAAGDDVRVVEAPESGHFEMIDPDSTTWPLLIQALRDLLER
ncbi:MAG TPA: alpha/beta hydrolase [Vicinamibacteria bacterium]|nr:alpha/beta hydrolase [Vicinamibacteria bacterium]